jgi:hypothetical protein
MYGLFGGIFSFATISTMSFMSIERYLVVRYPLYSLKNTNNFKISILIN